MILNKPGVKCTLMANQPLGDIELVFASSKQPTSLVSDKPISKHQEQDTTRRPPAMRVRFSRHQRSLEIARITGSKSGQWMKKVFATLPWSPSSGMEDVKSALLSSEEWKTLEGVEMDALREV